MRSILVILLLAASSITAGAQTLWRGRATTSNLGIEFLKPSFTDRNAGYTGLVTTLSAGFALGSATAIVVEIPLIFSSYSSFSSYDESALGNPYFGLQLGPAGSDIFGDLGVRVPMIGETQQLSGGLATLTDINRFEAYVPHLFQISGALNVDKRIAPTLRLLARLGPSADFSTLGGNADLYADYGLTLELVQDELTLGAGYSARTLLSVGVIEDRTVDEIAVGGYFRFERIEPGLQARFPMDEYMRRQLSFVYGLSVRLLL